MTYRYVIYSIVAFVFSLLLVNVKVLYDLKERLASEEKRIRALKANVYAKEADLKKFKKVIEEEKIELLSKDQALERLLSFVDRLKKKASIKTMGNLRDVNGMWTTEAVFEREVSSTSEVVGILKELLNTNSPMADILEMKIDREQSKLTIKVVLKQPYTRK